MAPVQVKLLPVTDAVQDFCKDIQRQAMKKGIRVEVDRGADRLAKQIRNAEQARIPLLAVVGMKEMETGTLAVRSRKEGDLGSWKIDDFFSEILGSVDATEEMVKMGEFIEVEAQSADE